MLVSISTTIGRWFAPLPHLYFKEVRMLRAVLSHPLGRTTLAVIVIAAITATTWVGDVAVARGGKKRIEAKITAKADKPGSDGKQKVVVVLDVNAGWYAHANPVGNEEFANNATVIKVKAKDKVDVKIAYPPGKVKKDVLGDINIYEGKTEIPLTVQRAPGDTSPLEVTVTVNICNVKGICLPENSFKGVCPPSETVQLQP